MKDAKYWVDKLEMQKHPEGGYFRETYRAQEVITETGLPSRYSGERNIATAIYYLLAEDDFSAFHRIKSDEIWHFYQGTGLELFEINTEGNLGKILLGPDPDRGMQFQYTIAAGNWFASRVIKKRGYALMGCTVAPGFDFSDFELAQRDQLISSFPQHKNIINGLCNN